MNQTARPQMRPGVAVRPGAAPAAAPQSSSPAPVQSLEPAPAPAAPRPALAAVPVRSDAETRQKLDALLPRYERLRSEQIRAQGDVERAAEELAAAEEAAMAALGTKDPSEIERMLAEARGENASVVDEFETLIAGLETDLKALSNT